MRPLRVGWIVRLLAGLFAAYLRLVYATMRWEREGQEQAEGVWKAGGGAILCFWHARIPLAPQSWPNEAGRRQEIRALISLSADGEFIARAVSHIGFPAIRGSSKKRGETAKDKGGAQALRDMLRWVSLGGAVAITPDGPRGPAEVMQKGAPVLAQMSAAPVLLVGLASKPCLRLGTWDRTLIPLPFSKGAMVWDGPLTAERGDDVEKLAEDWAARLSAATRRAEAMLGGAD